MTLEETIKLEGDYKEWVYKTDNNLSYKCVIKRSSMCFLLGYIHLTEDSDIYGQSDIDISAHGGVTYSEYEDNDWVIGFDCGHFGDLSPSLLGIGINYRRDVYRDMQYVTDQCNSMAEQISKISPIQLRDVRISSLYL